MSNNLRIQNIVFLILISAFSVVSCKKASLPTVITGSVNQITQTSAYSGGQITGTGSSIVTKTGVCWDTSINPTVDKSSTSDTTVTGIFISHITGLTPGTVYYVRAYATSGEGTAYGDMVSFTTEIVAVPSLNTSGLKSLTPTSASGGGYVSNDGGLAVTERGICWNTSGSATIADNHTSDGSGAGLFYSTLTDLVLNTTYHVRAYATNSMGTSYGNDIEYTHQEPILDNDGNAYSVIPIGTQTWMGENLKTTTYNDGVPIPNISTGSEWAIMTTPAFCWYNNNESQVKDSYGAIYNWYAVNTGKLCPTGWHVPTADEYNTLFEVIGGLDMAGAKLKEAGEAHWAYPNMGATNSYGFSALPGGGRYTVDVTGGVFRDLGFYGYLWSSSVGLKALNAVSFDMYYNLNLVQKSEYGMSDGGSVRCIKDIQ